MIPIASIIKEYEEDYIQEHSDLILPSHYKALHAMKTCRSTHSHKMLMQCESKECSNRILVPHSCGNRHCPHCQNHETTLWIDKQLKKQVPSDYFMVTFTLPAQFRAVAWFNQRTLYSALFNSAWNTIKLFSLNDKKLGGTPGAVAVLHTNSRELNFHPHIHILMPAATIDKTNRLWKKKSSKYLFNHKALAKVFRAKMLDALTTNSLSKIPLSGKLPQNYPSKWVVDCKHVGKGKKALIYLSRYLYRGVISENNIISCKNGIVTFKYKNSKTNKYQTKSVKATRFLWLVLQHILPRNFRRARNYGFLHPNSKKTLLILRWVFRVNSDYGKQTEVKPRKKMVCSCCGAFMEIIKTRIKPYELIPEVIP